MKQIDLNLFVVFDTIMREQSITAAAERLALTQPSVSNAVSRMRQAWGDPLFVKHGRGIKPTAMAVDLWQQIGSPLEKIRDAANKDTFEAETANRTFRIAVTDLAVDLLWLPMRQIIEKEAPGINLHAIPFTRKADVILQESSADLIIDVSLSSHTTLNSTWIFDNHYVCAMRHDHPLAGQEMTMENFLKADHLLMSLSGEASGVVDELLAQNGLKRRIACTVNHFSALPNMLINSNLISIIPRPVVEQGIYTNKLFLTAPPMKILPAPISMIWHRRNEHDPGLKWLKEKFLDAVASEIKNYSASKTN
jgi:DNA-binding transcriptional LysR family regulator